MDTMYVDGRTESREGKRLLAAGKVLLWAVMIGVSIFLASQSLMNLR